MQSCTVIIVDSIYKLLGNSMRWQWEISKIYEDFNILVYMGNMFDSENVGKKELYMASWFYYYGIDIIIKQVLTGFHNNMYEVAEFPYVLHVL